ncbi:Os01g0574451 [Oryza sativa Japonica Group]|uniref:Os01g0574451 protein n=1 Tax=Oryza sativa subsp. japonica TaxID=39947 RepID=A0A0P0V4C8_ORYSJ|nr:Os01g0574451 [Oryza sativa Japonica Group]
MPYFVTIALAILVAFWKSDDAPDVTSLSPKISSSATRPAMETSSHASICFREKLVSSFSGSWDTIPRVLPLGTMVALWTGRAPSVWMATRACPPSWYAVNFRDSSEITADLRSLPIMIRSLAYSRSFIVTAFAPSMAALRAATFTKLARSAPENPGVPLAMIIKSTSSLFTFNIWDSRICRRPSTSGFGTTICRSKRPGLTSALSRD